MKLYAKRLCKDNFPIYTDPSPFNTSNFYSPSIPKRNERWFLLDDDTSPSSNQSAAAWKVKSSLSKIFLSNLSLAKSTVVSISDTYVRY